MTQIAAAGNAIIDFDQTTWQLNRADGQTIMKASPDGLHYGERFARSRRLPEEGHLPRALVVQVVAGWQARDESWHLGVIIGPPLSEQRGSRWCELAHWPDPDQSVFDALIREAGQSLGDVLRVPFVLVPPRRSVPITEPTPPPPTVELLPLPIKAGLWRMERVTTADESAKGTPVEPDQLVLTRSGVWLRQHVFRALWYVFWMAIYLVLSIATLTSEIALPNAGTLLPNPQVLPYVGLGTAVLLAILVLWNLYRGLSGVNTIIVDPVRRSLSGWRGGRQRWYLTAGDIHALYVSELVKRRQDDPNIEHGEINVHLGEKQFRFVLQQSAPESNDRAPIPMEKPPRKKDALLPLRREMAFSHLQTIGLYMAEALDVPCWYDMRVK